MRRLRMACFWISVVCIVAGALLSLLLVWELVAGPWVQQVALTILVLFLASTLTLAVIQASLVKLPIERGEGAAAKHGSKAQGENDFR